MQALEERERKDMNSGKNQEIRQRVIHKVLPASQQSTDSCAIMTGRHSLSSTAAAVPLAIMCKMNDVTLDS